MCRAGFNSPVATRVRSRSTSTAYNPPAIYPERRLTLPPMHDLIVCWVGGRLLDDQYPSAVRTTCSSHQGLMILRIAPAPAPMLTHTLHAVPACLLHGSSNALSLDNTTYPKPQSNSRRRRGLDVVVGLRVADLVRLGWSFAALRCSRRLGVPIYTGCSRTLDLKLFLGY